MTSNNLWILERDGCKPVVDPSARMIRNHLGRLDLHRRSRYAHLTDEEGNWIQVLGGQLCCVIERCRAGSGRVYRAWRRDPLALYRNIEGIGHVTYVPVAPDEVFRMGEAADLFVAFGAGDPDGSWATWRDVTAARGSAAKGFPTRERSGGSGEDEE